MLNDITTITSKKILADFKNRKKAFQFRDRQIVRAVYKIEYNLSL